MDPSVPNDGTDVVSKSDGRSSPRRRIRAVWARFDSNRRCLERLLFALRTGKCVGGGCGTYEERV